MATITDLSVVTAVYVADDGVSYLIPIRAVYGTQTGLVLAASGDASKPDFHGKPRHINIYATDSGKERNRKVACSVGYLAAPTAVSADGLTWKPAGHTGEKIRKRHTG